MLKTIIVISLTRILLVLLLYVNGRSYLLIYPAKYHDVHSGCMNKALLRYLPDVYRKYLDAVNLHAAWLKENERSSRMVGMIVSSYNAILTEMKAALISSIVEYDFRPMALAMLFQCQVSKIDR